MKINELLTIKKLPNNIKVWIDVKAGELLLNLSDDINANYTIVIGQRIQCIACCSVPILGVQWYIDGLQYTVADYNTSTVLGQKTIINPQDLVSNPITFSWWKSNTYNVTCIINTPYGPGQVTHSFNVTAPLVRDFNSMTGVVGVGKYNGLDFIRFVKSMENFNEDGIFMNAIVAGTQCVPGIIAAIQLVCNQRFSTHTAGGSYKLDTNGIKILDIGMTNTVFYQNYFENINNDQQNINYEANDGPGQQLDSSIINAMLIGDGDVSPSIPERYEMYLMFYPNVPGAIWVPIKVLSWGWEGCTSFAGGNWQPATETGVPEPISDDPADFPQWNRNTSQNQWIPY